MGRTKNEERPGVWVRASDSMPAPGERAVRFLGDCRMGKLGWKRAFAADSALLPYSGAVPVTLYASLSQSVMVPRSFDPISRNGSIMLRMTNPARSMRV
jgi:hypothetical protein